MPKLKNQMWHFEWFSNTAAWKNHILIWGSIIMIILELTCELCPQIESNVKVAILDWKVPPFYFCFDFCLGWVIFTANFWKDRQFGILLTSDSSLYFGTHLVKRYAYHISAQILQFLNFPHYLAHLFTRCL